MVKRTKIHLYIQHFLIEQKESNNLLTNTNLITLVKSNYNLNIDKSTVSKILKNKNKFLNIPSNNSCKIVNNNLIEVEDLLFN